MELTKQVLGKCVAELTAQIDVEYESASPPRASHRRNLCVQRAAYIKVHDLVLKGKLVAATHFIRAMCPDWSAPLCKVVNQYTGDAKAVVRESFARELGVYVAETVAFTITEGV